MTFRHSPRSRATRTRRATGPRTQDGKAVVGRNAITYGLFAKLCSAGLSLSARAATSVLHRRMTRICPAPLASFPTPHHAPASPLLETAKNC